MDNRDYLAMNKRNKKTNGYTAVIRWFVTMILCVLVQTVFMLISSLLNNEYIGIAAFGGWLSCMVYYHRHKK